MRISLKGFERKPHATPNTPDTVNQDGIVQDIRPSRPRSKRMDNEELGPYATEERMPSWLIKVLSKGEVLVAKAVLTSDGTVKSEQLKVVETPGIIPALARLTQEDNAIEQVIFCSPLVHQVSKLRREGSFCGYRNIQMLLSYIRNVEHPGHSRLHDRPLPSIFELQDWIETAWRMGYNASGLQELGHLQMTRKFIGTSEVEALLLSLSVPVSGKSFVSSPEASAAQSLMEYLSLYFGLSQSISDRKVLQSELPPVYLQRPGHSVTIVGIERSMKGSSNLIIFDPRVRPSSDMKKVALGLRQISKPEKLLCLYRYGMSELMKHDAYEILQLDRHDSGT